MELLERRLLPATFTWTGAVTGNANWSNSNNWSPVGVPSQGDDVAFPGGAAQLLANNDLTGAGPAGIEFRSLSFTGNAGGYVLQGNPFILDAGLANNSNNPTQNTISVAGPGITLNGSQTFSGGTSGGSLGINSNMNLASFTLSLDGSTANTKIAGTVVGSGGIVKNGTGIWVLGGSNTYGGLTTINAGMLIPDSGTAFGSSSVGTVVNAGGTLGVNVKQSTAVNFPEPLTLNGNGGAFAGAINVGNLAADVNVTGPITFGSATSIVSTVSSPNRLILTNQVSTNGFNLTLNGSLNLNVGGAVLGGGAVVSNAALVSGTGTLSGPLIVAQGALLPGSATQPGILTTGPVTFNPGTSFQVLLNGTAAGSAFSQLQVNGAVSLAGSTFQPTLNFNPAVGNSFVVINSTGSITGTFNGLPNGAIVTLNGQPFQVLYISGGQAGHLEASSQVILTRVASATGGGGAFGSIPPGVNAFATAADAGGGPDVKVFSATTGTALFNFFAYDPNFTGGVRVAVGDVNGDGVIDLITAAGPGGGPNIIVRNGKDGSSLFNFFAYDIHFTGGVYVACGDVNGDGFADMICGADGGGGPNVTVFSGKDGSILRSFFAYDMRFTGGVRVAAGDVNGDGKADIICGAGPGGGPNVTIFNGADGAILRSFFAYDPGFGAGIYVAAGDVNGDGKADVITGAGAGGGPNVSVFDVSTLTVRILLSFFPYDPSFVGGVRVTAASRGSATNPNVITVPGPGGAPDVRSFNGVTGQLIDQFFAYNPLFTGGLYLAGTGR